MKRRRKHQLKAEMNVVPYIDVMLVLLVIFMIATPLIRQQTIKIDLPDNPPELLNLANGADLRVLPIVLSIDSSGNYYLNRGENPTRPQSPATIRQIVQQILTANPNLPAIVQGDAGVPYEKIFAGIILLQQAGASSVSLSGETPPKKGAKP